ncbi:MAG: hypothetical protein AAF587_20245 [Bacteroidota bacterium]
MQTYLIHILILFLSCLMIAGCYYDNEETLYPPLPDGVESCETSDLTYAGTIVPIMEASCSTPDCHEGNTPADNLDLTVYSEVRQIANNGKLFGVVAHLAGFSKMPRNGNKLSDCQINQIDIWIQEGAQNN